MQVFTPLYSTAADFGYRFEVTVKMPLTFANPTLTGWLMVPCDKLTKQRLLNAEKLYLTTAPMFACF
jgi:hypothetical protein